MPIAALLIAAVGAGVLGLRLRQEADPRVALRSSEVTAESTVDALAERIDDEASPQIPPATMPGATAVEPVGRVADAALERPQPRATERQATMSTDAAPPSETPQTIEALRRINQDREARKRPAAPIPGRADATDDRFAIEGMNIDQATAVGASPTFDEFPNEDARIEPTENADAAPRTEAESMIIAPIPAPPPPPPYTPPPPPAPEPASPQVLPMPMTKSPFKLKPVTGIEEAQERHAAARAVPQSTRSAPTDALSGPRTVGADEYEARRLAVPPKDVTFRDYGVNRFVDTRADPESTFGLEVDTASFNIVRRYLTDGRWPDPAAVRVEELVNAFDYDDPAPKREDFAVHAELAPAPRGFGHDTHLLRFAIKAREVDANRRASTDLILVIDTSGSMNQGNRLALVKDSVTLLLGQLRPDDRVGLVTFGSEAQIALLPTDDHDEVRNAVRRLHAGGSTNAAHGLDLGYRLADDYRRSGATSRVMMLSDGVANVGATSAEAMLARVAGSREAGVELTTVGVGMGNYNDVLLEQLADRGDGRYAYVDDYREAHRLFVDTIMGTLVTVAEETKVQVVFDPEVVERYRLIGYENRAIADRDFRNDRVDAGEIGAGHTAVAVYEVKLFDDVGRLSGRQTIATLNLRHRSTRASEMGDGEMVENAYRVTNRMRARSFDAASPAFRLTALVVQAAEILRRSPYVDAGGLDRVFRETHRVSSAYAGDARLADWVALLGRASRLDDRQVRDD